ncbi:MAG TPA: flagellar basal body P-ring protein FlgI, partial [Beijerinckiaceae bacterium]
MTRALAICLALVAALAATPAAATSRIKDLTTLNGVRENQIIGYGLVVGLQGTGDSLRNAAFTEQSMQS